MFGCQDRVMWNAEQEPVPANHPIPLSDGDKIHVGAWTTVAMERLDNARPVTPMRTAVRPRTPETWPDRTGAPRSTCSARSGCGSRGGGPDRRGEEASRPGAARPAVGISGLGRRSRVALWGEEETKTAVKALQGYVVELRQVLPEDTIETTSPLGYRLSLPKDSIDAGRFERR